MVRVVPRPERSLASAAVIARPSPASPSEGKDFAHVIASVAKQSSLCDAKLLHRSHAVAELRHILSGEPEPHPQFLFRRMCPQMPVAAKMAKPDIVPRARPALRPGKKMLN